MENRELLRSSFSMKNKNYTLVRKYLDELIDFFYYFKSSSVLLISIFNKYLIMK